MDNLKIKQISRDVYVDENSHTYEAIEITQGTNGGIELVFYLYENGIPYILQNSDSIKYKLIGARPDGEAIIRYPKSVYENRLIFDNITSFMTCIVGTYSVRIEMADLNGTSNILVNDIQLSIFLSLPYRPQPAHCIIAPQHRFAHAAGAPLKSARGREEVSLSPGRVFAPVRHDRPHNCVDRSGNPSPRRIVSARLQGICTCRCVCSYQGTVKLHYFLYS